MNILVVSSFLPYPLYSGGHIRLYNLIKQLSKKHTITLVCEKRTYQTQEDINAVKKICADVITVDRKKQWSYVNILKTGLSKHAFLTTGHNHPEMKKIISDLLRSKPFNIIHVETSYVYQNLPQTSLPIVLVEHNLEYEVYKRFSLQAPLAMRPLLLIDVKKLQREEQQYWQQANRVVAVSELEESVIKNFTRKTSVVPNGVDTKNFGFYLTNGKLEKKEKVILFIGDFKWLQNRDAVKFILTDIWPHLESRISKPEGGISVMLWIVGRSIPLGLKQLANSPNIIFDEGASGPTSEIFQKADVLLAPIRVGGGTQYKILEAMAVGTPVVTTSLGSEGIRVHPNQDIIIADKGVDLAKQTSELLLDKKWYTTIAKNGRLLIEKFYSWEIIARELERVYESVV